LPTILQKKRPGITGFISNNQTLRTAGKKREEKGSENNCEMHHVFNRFYA
jgi:hypothetical protein